MSHTDKSNNSRKYGNINDGNKIDCSDVEEVAQETIISADIAADRSGNKRAVNRCKESGFIKRGLHQNSDPAMMDDVWLAWSFQANFMYNSVL